MTTRKLSSQEDAIIAEAVGRAYDKKNPSPAKSLAEMHGSERQIAETAAWTGAAKAARLVSPFWSAE